VSERAKLEFELGRLAEEIAQLFVSRCLTLAVAESCTGGLISHSLTNLPGSSRFFLAGLCVYSIDAKVNVLGRLLCGSNVGLATTGYAGPATGVEKLPVGTVFIAMSTEKASPTHEFHYKGDRLGVKLAAAIDALRLLLHESMIAISFPKH